MKRLFIICVIILSFSTAYSQIQAPKGVRFGDHSVQNTKGILPVDTNFKSSTSKGIETRYHTAITYQPKLISATNIKTINGSSLLGSGDITISGSGGTWGTITGTLSGQTDLQNALDAKQAALISATNIKTINGSSLLGSGNISISTVTYPGSGIPNSTGSAWGASYAVGTSANNLVQLNSSAQLPAVSAALLTNFPTLNQNTTGSAATLTTSRTLAGNNFNGSANVIFSNKFIVQGTSDAGLSGAQFLGALGSGIVKNTTSTGVLSIASAGSDYVAPTTTVNGHPLSGNVTVAYSDLHLDPDDTTSIESVAFVHKDSTLDVGSKKIETRYHSVITYQGKLTLTTTGTSGAATLTGNTLNIPQYSGGGSMTWPSGGAGIPNYNGSSAWGASYTTSGSGTVIPLATGASITTPQVILATPGSSLTANGILITVTAGENLVFGDVVYIKSDGKYWKAKADAATTVPVVGMALGSISANASGNILQSGLVRNDSWSWTTVGGQIWLSVTTAGAITQTKPSDNGNQLMYIGYAKSATEINFNPSQIVFETTAP